jgi:hypothetical protein
MTDILKAPQAYAAEIFALGFSATDYRESKYFELMSDKFNRDVVRHLERLNAIKDIKASKGKVVSLMGQKMSYVGNTFKGEHIVIRKGFDGVTHLIVLDDSGLLMTFTDAVTVAGERVSLCWAY